MSAMLGSGIFVLPGLAAGMTGPSVWMAYLVAGLCVLPAALSKAELATAMPASGGTYVYVERTFGPLAGTVVGLGLWLSLLLKSAFALDGFAAYLEVLAHVPPKAMALTMLALIVVLNIVGVRKVGRVQTAVVFTALGALIVLVCFGLPRIESGLLASPFSTGVGGFVGTTAFVFVSYAGVTAIDSVAEEVRDPSRTLPRGIVISLVGAMTMYMLVVLTLVGHIPAADLGDDLRPLYSLATAIGGPSVGIAMAILAVFTMSAMANAGLLSSSRFPFALSRDGLLPATLQRLHPAFLTPVRGILLTGAVMATVIVLFDVEAIARLASTFILLIFLVENLAVLVLRETGVAWYKPTYRAPFYPLTQIAGGLAMVALLAALGMFALLAGAAVAVPGLLVFLMYGRRSTERRGVLGKLGPRQDLVVVSARKSGALGPTTADRPDAVVALLGYERSPETLVEMAASLTNHQRIRVLQITEIPDQVMREAVGEDDARTRSLRRRLEAMAADEGLTIDFESTASRDVVRTVHERTLDVGCSWLVMEWRARSRGSFLMTAPLGWLTQRLACNFAVFRDVGVRYVRQILAYVEPGPHDALVVSTADHLSQLYRAELILARFVPDGTPLPMVQAQLDYLDELRGLASRPTRCQLLTGTSEAATIIEASAAYDLLVLGAPPERGRIRSWRTSLQDRINERAGCSVLRLRTSRIRVHDRPAPEPRAESGGACFDLLRFVETRFIGVGLPKTKKEQIFESLAAVFAEALPRVAARDIVAALWARERTQNTSVGEGVAMPHATLPEADRLYVGIFTLAAPMPYDAIDDRPVDVLFVTLGPPSERQTHLRVLGGLSGLVLRTGLLADIRAAASAQDVVAAIGRARAELAKPPSPD